MSAGQDTLTGVEVVEFQNVTLVAWTGSGVLTY